MKPIPFFRYLEVWSVPRSKPDQRILDIQNPTDNGKYIITDEELLTLVREVERLSSNYGLSVADYNTTGCPGNSDLNIAMDHKIVHHRLAR